jgi:hypothetical protein
VVLVVVNVAAVGPASWDGGSSQVEVDVYWLVY